MQTIIPHLWYDTEAKEAAEFYVDLFGGKIDWTYTITDTPSGDSDLVQFQLGDMTLAAISAGPYFKLNESMSLMVSVADKADVTRLYEALSDGGRVLMPLGEYPFSPYYVWLEDRFGLSWQLSYEPDLDKPYQFDICLLFSQDQVSLAQPMLDYYKDKLPQARLGHLSYYGEGEAAVAAAKLNYAELFIGDQKSSLWTTATVAWPLSTKPSRSWSMWIARKKQRAGMKKCRQFQKQRFAVGPRISLGFLGRLYRGF